MLTKAQHHKKRDGPQGLPGSSMYCRLAQMIETSHRHPIKPLEFIRNTEAKNLQTSSHKY